MPRVSSAEQLPAPTPEVVDAKIAEFEEDNSLVESALKTLIATFPQNTERAHVLLKVAAINTLYSTQIRAVTVVADLIWKANIDAKLKSGDPNLVTEISWADFGGKRRCNYSFATKYCSWHQPDLYPIYDSRVDYVLRVYAKQEPFSDFTEETLWEYPEFRRMVSDFRRHFSLENYSYKKTDEFLYQLGDRFFRTGMVADQDMSA